MVIWIEERKGRKGEKGGWKRTQSHVVGYGRRHLCAWFHEPELYLYACGCYAQVDRAKMIPKPNAAT